MSIRVAHGLPANPRSIAGGRSTSSRQFEAPRPTRPSAIPSNPRPRAASIHRRPAPETYERSRGTPHRRYPSEVRGSHRSEDSVSTSSSSDSSYWPRGRSSQNSSRTTLQSERNMKYDDQTNEIPAKEYQATNPYIDPNFVWGRVTEAATALTQEVSKVWAAGLSASVDNESTEEESHLTRVMRAYHLSKARTPAELPDWLFSERERGQGGLLRSSDKADSHGDGRPMKSVPVQQVERRNRPTHGDNTALLGTQSRRHQDAQIAEHTKPLVPQAKPSGSDRLKQLRELRRNAPSAF